MFSNSDKKFYFYDNKNNGVVTINYKDTDPITIEVLKIDKYSYAEDIQIFFGINIIPSIIIEKSKESISGFPPINIIIGEHKFFHFNIAHRVADKKNVLFARLDVDVDVDDESNEFLFIFRDKHGVLFKNEYKLIEHEPSSIDGYLAHLPNQQTIDHFNKAYNQHCR